MKHVGHRAFTLVEVMIVVTIIAILVSFAVPSFISYRKTAHAQACARNMNQVKVACRTYMINHGSHTTDLKTLQTAGGGLLKESSSCCPVGGEYTITFDEKTQDFTVTCSLADKDEHNVTEVE